MGFCDIHVHSQDCSGADILKAMDEVGMEKMAVLAPYMAGAHHRDMSDALQKDSTDIVAKICAADPSRLISFAFIEPSLPRAVLAVEYAVEEKGIRGIKMIPNHWYPYDAHVFPVYAMIEKYRRPLLFHSGILWAFDDSSRFCRPCFFEALLHFPKIKFALAHISWPWTDECIATAGRMRSAARREEGRKMQMYIDTTRGTPDIYRREALHRAIEYVGADNILFGSDGRVPSNLRYPKEGYDKDRSLIIDELGYDKKVFEQIMVGTFEEFLRPME